MLGLPSNHVVVWELSFRQVRAAFVRRTQVSPWREFFERYGYTPADILAMQPWLVPDTNPFPRFRFFRWLPG